MLITKEADYAIRIMRSLKDKEKHTVKDICQAEGVPESFAYRDYRQAAEGRVYYRGAGPWPEGAGWR